MSNNFNFTSPAWSQPDRRLGREYGFNPRPGPSQPPAATIDETRGAYFDPWGTRDDLFVTGPLGLIGLMQPNSLPLFDDYTTSTNESRLSQDEQTEALKKLRKNIYNPIPKKLSSNLCLYYRDKALDVVNERAKGKEEDEKNCAVCLEDFEPKEMVMVTPCNHMFHEDCIVPWVKSHGQCPVCRFVLSAGEGSGGGRRRTAPIAGTLNSNFIPNLPNSSRLLSPDLISFLRSIGVI